MNDVHYLALAYLCGLVLFLAYLYILDRYQKHLHKEIEHLESVIKRVHAPPGPGAENVPEVEEPPQENQEPPQEVEEPARELQAGEEAEHGST